MIYEQSCHWDTLCSDYATAELPQPVLQPVQSRRRHCGNPQLRSHYLITGPFVSVFIHLHSLCYYHFIILFGVISCSAIYKNFLLLLSIVLYSVSYNMSCNLSLTKDPISQLRSIQVFSNLTEVIRSAELCLNGFFPPTPFWR